jgi:nucleotide-binding universal stress UspA family protein
MYDTILLPTDGRPDVANAVGHGVALARVAAGTVHGLYVVDTRAEPPGLDEAARADLRRESRDRGRHAVAAVADRAAEADLDARTEVREGVPGEETVAYAREHDVDLIVLATDPTDRGSDATRVVALTDVPVLAVPRAADVDRATTDRPAFERLVVPTDGSGAAERAADHGLELAGGDGATIHAVYVVDTTVYDLADAPRSVVGLLEAGGRNAVAAVADAAAARNVPATTEVLRGVPAETVRTYARDVDAGLIVVGSRGRSAADDPLLGSTTTRLVRRADRPVLVVQ